MSPFARLLVLAAFSFVPAFADGITIEVFGHLAPNTLSPSWSAYVRNALMALESGAASTGAVATDPSAYREVSEITAEQNILTDFHFWMGEADPTGIFAKEMGNRLFFGVVIQGNGTEFSLSDVSFAMTSTDPTHYFDFAAGFGSRDVYSTTRVGYREDVGYITSGPATQSVNALYYLGLGSAPVVRSSYPGATNEEKVHYALAAKSLTDPFSITTTYMVDDDFDNVLASGSGTVLVNAHVPEPSSLVLLATVVAGVGIVRCRTRRASKI